ncbi:MAG: hypothetical protein H0V18_05815 [Pyrinomonadaceae bacterium]|nr:hypothetical protein [Pyrinomonadaceae bacterium]
MLLRIFERDAREYDHGAMGGSGTWRRLAYSTRTWLGSHRLTYPLLRLARAGAVVTSRTQACIEGFPRSANTWAVFPFRMWNPDVCVAHHVHVPMQIRRAVSLDVPCAVLVRKPLDALTSLLVMDEDRLSDAVACHSYTTFYDRILDLREHVVTCTFEEVTEDPFTVVTRLNARYGTDFQGVRLDGDERAALRDRIERYHRREGFREAAFTVPSETRRRAAAGVRERLQAHPALEPAEDAYRRWLGKAS